MENERSINVGITNPVPLHVSLLFKKRSLKTPKIKSKSPSKWCSRKIIIGINEPPIKMAVHQNILSGSARPQTLAGLLCHEIVFIFLVAFGGTFRLKVIFILFFIHKCLSYIVFDYLEQEMPESCKQCKTACSLEVNVLLSWKLGELRSGQSNGQITNEGRYIKR